LTPIIPTTSTTTTQRHAMDTTSQPTMSSSSFSSFSSTPSPFLALPAELRQKIYTHLLTTPHPIRGPLARGTQTYALHTSILRTSRLIHTEARSIFFSHNTFVITSLPSLSLASDDNGSGAFEPPLQPHDLALVRRLEIDVLFYPKVLRCLEGRKYGGWSPVCPAAERYVGSLIAVLGAVEKTLLELKLGADTRRFAKPALPSCSPTMTTTTTTTAPLTQEYAGNGYAYADEDMDTDADTELGMRKILTGFHMLDRNPRFRDALAKLTCIPSIALHFDFVESFFDFDVERHVLCAQRFTGLAGQVLVQRDAIRARVAMREADEDGEGDVDMEGAGEVRIECLTTVLECE